MDMQALFPTEADTATAILQRKHDALTASIKAADDRCAELQQELAGEQQRRAHLAITKASVAGALNTLRGE